MTRETSRKAYEELLESGTVPKHQGQILAVVVATPDLTSGEILGKLEVQNVNAWRARFTELQQRGLIVESGTRKCSVSGRTALTWRYSERTKPLKHKRPKATRAELTALLKRAAVLLDGSPPSKILANDIKAAL